MLAVVITFFGGGTNGDSGSISEGLIPDSRMTNWRPSLFLKRPGDPYFP